MTDGTDPLVQAIADLKTSVNSLRDELVRKDVYVEARAADKAEVAALAADLGEIKGTITWLMRTVVASLAMPIASSAIIIYVVQAAAR